MRQVKNKFVSIFLAVFLFVMQSVLAYSSESNFWNDRNRNQSKSDNSQSLEIASIPSTLSFDSSNFVQQLPALLPEIHRLPQPIKTYPHRATRQKDQLRSVLETLNSGYGSVRNISLASASLDKGKTVIHIQDVHLNEDAQKNIGKTLALLLSNQQIGLVGLEGAVGDIDLTEIRSFKNKKAVEMVSNYLLKENRITGPLHALINTPSLIPTVVGVEESSFYKANLYAYQTAIPFQAQSKRQFEEIKNEFIAAINSALKENKPLREYHNQVQSYRNEELSMGDFVAATAALLTDIPTSAQVFLEAYKTEKALNFSLVESERSALLSHLLAKLSKSEINHLVNTSMAYRMGSLPHADFYNHLKQLCTEKNVSLSTYKEMNAYIQYVLLAQSIQPEKLMVELVSMEKKVYDNLAQNQVERDFVNTERSLFLAGKLLDFSLTPNEWNEYKKNNTQTHVGIDLMRFEQFYRNAEARNSVMSENLLNAMSMSKSQVSVLVTGGFHSPGIDELLKKSGVTVITVVPKISKVDMSSGSQYLSVFAQEKTPLDQLFKGEKLFLAPHPNQTALALPLAEASHIHLTTGEKTVAIKKESGQLIVNFVAGLSIDSVEFVSKTNKSFLNRLRIIFLSSFLWMSSFMLGVQQATAQFNPQAPMQTLRDAIAFVDYQNTNTLPSTMRATPLPPAYYIPPGLTGYAVGDSRAIDQSISLYGSALAVYAKLLDPTSKNVTDAENMLRIWAGNRFGNMQLDAFPSSNNNFSYGPFTSTKKFRFNTTRTTGLWDASWNFWDVDTGPNAWLLLAVSKYVEVKRSLGQTPQASIVAMGNQTAEALLLLQTPEGAFRFGPKRNNDTTLTYWNLISVENNESTYAALHFWSAMSGNSAYATAANRIWTWLTESPVYVLRNGVFVTQNGFLHNDALNTYFYRGASFNTSLNGWVADEAFTTDASVTWAFSAFGIEKIVSKYGPEKAMRMYQSARRLAGRNNSSGPVQASTRLDGFDFISHINGVAINSGNWLISPEWSDPNNLEELIDSSLRSMAFGDSLLTLEEVAALTKDYYTLGANLRTTNGLPYLYGPGTGGTRRSYTGFNTGPLKREVRGMASILPHLNNPLAAVRETTNAVLRPQGFRAFLKSYGELLSTNNYFVSMPKATNNASVSYWRTNAQRDEIYTSVVNKGEAVAVLSFTKTATGGTNKQSFVFGPESTTINILHNGESFTRTLNSVEHGLFVKPDTNGVLQLYLTLPEENNIPEADKNLIDQGVIKLWNRVSPVEEPKLNPALGLVVFSSFIKKIGRKIQAFFQFSSDNKLREISIALANAIKGTLSGEDLNKIILEADLLGIDGKFGLSGLPEEDQKKLWEYVDENLEGWSHRNNLQEIIGRSFTISSVIQGPESDMLNRNFYFIAQDSLSDDGQDLTKKIGQAQQLKTLGFNGIRLEIDRIDIGKVPTELSENIIVRQNTIDRTIFANGDLFIDHARRSLASQGSAVLVLDDHFFTTIQSPILTTDDFSIVRLSSLLTGEPQIVSLNVLMNIFRLVRTHA